MAERFIEDICRTVAFIGFHEALNISQRVGPLSVLDVHLVVHPVLELRFGSLCRLPRVPRVVEPCFPVGDLFDSARATALREAAIDVEEEQAVARYDSRLAVSCAPVRC